MFDLTTELLCHKITSEAAEYFLVVRDTIISCRRCASGKTGLHIWFMDNKQLRYKTLETHTGEYGPFWCSSLLVRKRMLVEAVNDGTIYVWKAIPKE